MNATKPIIITIYLLLVLSTVAATAGSPWDMAGLPPGRFRSQLEQLPAEIRAKALEKAEVLDIPVEDCDSLHVHPNGNLYYTCDFGGERPLAKKDRQLLGAGIAGTPGVATVFPASVPIASPPVFHSRPGSTNVLFLDFNGHVVSNTYWNSGSVASWDCRPYGFDGDETTFSAAEQQAIQTIWERVAEDYAPFNIDVTTEQPVAWDSHVGHVLITPETDKNGVECPHFSYGGIAYIDVFGEADYSYNAAGPCYSPAWVLNYETAGYAEYEADAATHEMGHNLALSHDGTRSTGYYGGHENGSISWGPIMGTGYDRNVSQWSKGDYRAANNTEDDLAIIAARLAYRPDDVGNDLLSSAPLSVGSTGVVSQAGVVETTTDADVFNFNASSGMVNIAVSPYRDQASTTWGGNLDIVIELYNGAGVLLATNNPTLETTASLSVLVDSGTYYLKIRSTGVGDPFKNPSPNGYVQYGSLGQYTITGSMPINPDVDGDGLPNEWEAAYFGSGTNAVATEDSDGDGQDNLSEFIAGFDPTNAASVFKVVDFSVASTNGDPVVVAWVSIAGRTYNVAWSDNLSEAAFSNLVEGLVYPQNSYTDTVDRAGLQNFYRVEVRLDQ